MDRATRKEATMKQNPIDFESWASSEAVRRNMRANRRRDTSPERLLRSELFLRGLRYRIDVRPSPDLNRRADLVFRRARVAVFVDGCFWHGCERHFVTPKTNTEFWITKIEANKQRDSDTDERLRQCGWIVVRVWEHECPAEAAERITKLLRGRGTGPSEGACSVADMEHSSAMSKPVSADA
jgi:DNA mismatch endonuclease, patch repair protein